MASANRLVIISRLHQIDEAVIKEHTSAPSALTHPLTLWEGSLLGAPKNSRELALRISVFWQAFYGDKACALMIGLPPTFDKNVRITTAFPMAYRDYATGAAFEVPYSSYDDLFASDGATRAHNIGPFAMVFQGMAILDRSVMLSSGVQAQSVTMSDLQGVQSAIQTLRTIFTTMCPDTPLAGGPTVEHQGHSFQETSFKSLMQLFILVSSIHATYIRPVDEMVRDDDALLVERLGCARLCANLVSLTNREMEVFAARAGKQRLKPGVEHLRVSTAHLLSAALNVLVEEMQVMEGSWEDAEADITTRNRKQEQIAADSANIDLLLDAIERVRETHKVTNDSSLDYTW